jgi:hypothetical protein
MSSSKNKEAREMVQEFVRQHPGATLRKSKRHWIVKYRGKQVVVAATPRTHRSLANQKALLKRLGEGTLP